MLFLIFLPLVLDAWGVAPQGGVLDGNWRYPGRYYECRKDYGGHIRGQWCNAAYGRRYEVRCSFCSHINRILP